MLTVGYEEEDDAAVLEDPPHPVRATMTPETSVAAPNTQRGRGDGARPPLAMAPALKRRSLHGDTDPRAETPRMPEEYTIPESVPGGGEEADRTSVRPAS